MLAAPGVLYFVVFHYLPFLGYIAAFQRYIPFLGFLGSEWVGLRNFQALADPAILSALRNTVIIALAQIVLFFPAPIAFALMLMSIRSTALRRIFQNIAYLPHFISWVIVISLFTEMLGGAGLVSRLLQQVDRPMLNVMSEPTTFPLLVTFQVVWREGGWAAIIYLAALLGIDPALYEAASVDGAGRWRQLWHITLPGIAAITIVLLILRLGTLLSVGFEQILLQRDGVGYEAGEVLDTWVYFQGVIGGNWGVAAAIGLLKGLFGAALLLSVNWMAHRMGSDGIYR